MSEKSSEEKMEEENMEDIERVLNENEYFLGDVGNKTERNIEERNIKERNIEESNIEKSNIEKSNIEKIKESYTTEEYMPSTSETIWFPNTQPPSEKVGISSILSQESSNLPNISIEERPLDISLEPIENILTKEKEYIYPPDILEESKQMRKKIESLMIGEQFLFSLNKQDLENLQLDDRIHVLYELLTILYHIPANVANKKKDFEKYLEQLIQKTVNEIVTQREYYLSDTLKSFKNGMDILLTKGKILIYQLMLDEINRLLSDNREGYQSFKQKVDLLVKDLIKAAKRMASIQIERQKHIFGYFTELLYYSRRKQLLLYVGNESLFEQQSEIIRQEWEQQVETFENGPTFSEIEKQLQLVITVLKDEKSYHLIKKNKQELCLIDLDLVDKIDKLTIKEREYVEERISLEEKRKSKFAKNFREPQKRKAEELRMEAKRQPNKEKEIEKENKKIESAIKKGKQVSLVKKQFNQQYLEYSSKMKEIERLAETKKSKLESEQDFVKREKLIEEIVNLTKLNRDFVIRINSLYDRYLSQSRQIDVGQIVSQRYRLIVESKKELSEKQEQVNELKKEIANKKEREIQQTKEEKEIQQTEEEKEIQQTREQDVSKLEQQLKETEQNLKHELETNKEQWMISKYRESIKEIKQRIIDKSSIDMLQQKVNKINKDIQLITSRIEHFKSDNIKTLEQSLGNIQFVQIGESYFFFLSDIETIFTLLGRKDSSVQSNNIKNVATRLIKFPFSLIFPIIYTSTYNTELFKLFGKKENILVPIIVIPELSYYLPINAYVVPEYIIESTKNKGTTLPLNQQQREFLSKPRLFVEKDY